MTNRYGRALVLAAAICGPAVFLPSANADCDLTVIVDNNAASNFARAPSIRYRAARSVYVLTPTELAASGLQPGRSPSGIGWTYTINPGASGAGRLKVYLQNTTASGYSKSSDWPTAISDMNLVHDAVTTLPDVAGSFTIPFSQPSSFTYAGAGLYIAFDWSYPTGPLGAGTVVDCNTLVPGGLVGMEGGDTPTNTLTSSDYRPETHLSVQVPHHDVGVDYVIALGAQPDSLIDNPLPNVRATITNHGDVPVSVPVTLNVTGEETYTDTQSTVILNACGGLDTVTFPDFTPTAFGDDTLTVSVPADDATANDTLSKPFELATNHYSYKRSGTLPEGGTGILGNTTGEVVARFTTSGPTQIDAVELEFYQPSAALYRVVIRGSDAGGGISSLLYLDPVVHSVTASGGLTLRIDPPVAVGQGSFFVGIRQMNGVLANYSYNVEKPLRYGLFYYSPHPESGPWTDFAVVGGTSQLNMGVILGACLNPLAVDVATGGATTACAGGGVPLSAGVAGGTGLFTYQWTQNGIDVPGATGPSFTPVKGAAGSFTYNCKVTDSGGCSNVQDPVATTVTWLANGAACTDGNGCTVNDACASGACTGTPIVVPGEVAGLSIQPDKQTLVWTSAAPAGAGTVHDVPRGLLSQLPVGSGAGETCLATTAGATTVDSATPGAGSGFWYLVRGRNTCGTGSYGTTSSSLPRLTSVCP